MRPAKGVGLILAKFLRLNNSWSLDDVRERTRVGVTTLCLIERKRFVPTDAMLQRLADVFNVTPPSALLREVTLKDLALVKTAESERA